MKCLILFVISLGVAMSFPSPQEHDAEELENQMTETELKDPADSWVAAGREWNDKLQFKFGVGQQGTHSRQIAVGHPLYYGKRHLTFGNPGKQVAVGHKLNGKRQMYFGRVGGSVGHKRQEESNLGKVPVKAQFNGRK